MSNSLLRQAEADAMPGTDTFDFVAVGDGSKARRRAGQRVPSQHFGQKAMGLVVTKHT
jgi:hypothetical protein